MATLRTHLEAVEALVLRTRRLRFKSRVKPPERPLNENNVHRWKDLQLLEPTTMATESKMSLYHSTEAIKSFVTDI